MDRIRYVPPRYKSKLGLDSDTLIKISLVGDNKLLPDTDLSRTISESDIFNKERNSCTKYRLIGTVKPIMSNVLFNLDSPGSTLDQNGNIVSYGQSWSVFNNDVFKYDYLHNPDTDTVTGSSYYQAVKEHLSEKNGWFGFYDPVTITTGTCRYNYMEPTPDRFRFVKKTAYEEPNWLVTVTYPYTSDTTHYMVSESNGANGLKITGQELGDIGGRQLTTFYTPTAHNLKQGDKVRLFGLSPYIFDGIYRVVRIGNNIGKSLNHAFTVEIEYQNITSLTTARLLRVVNGIESKYYLRIFKKINVVWDDTQQLIQNDDYDIYNAGFAKTIFDDEVPQFVVNEDIEINDIKDNLGRPLSEIYVTILKTHKEGLFFTKVKSGLELGFVPGVTDNISIPDIRQIYDDDNFVPTNTTIPTYPSPEPIEDGVLPTDETFYGDICEFNPYEQNEYVLSKVCHRFNTINRITDGVITNGYSVQGPRHEGYFYYPHHRVSIRDFSVYVEQGDQSTFNMPDYAYEIDGGRYLWRDLLDIGQWNGTNHTVDYPYLNGSHYLYLNICFPLRRQDPYNKYGLMYTGQNASQPNDIFGLDIGDNYILNQNLNDC